MAGKQAKILTDGNCSRMLHYVAKSRYPVRDRTMVLLSLKAGLRASEIAKLTWPMVLDSRGKIGAAIELCDVAAKRNSGRSIPLHPELKRSLVRLHKSSDGTGAVIPSERGGEMTANSVVNWFAGLYRALGFQGCSSHSGRRTFITNAARRVHRVGGSLRDIQQLAGHRSLAMTQGYIEGDTQIKRRLVALL